MRRCCCEFRLQLCAAPRSVTSAPKRAFASTLTHGIGGSALPSAATSITYSRPPGAKPPRPLSKRSERLGARRRRLHLGGPVARCASGRALERERGPRLAEHEARPGARRVEEARLAVGLRNADRVARLRVLAEREHRDGHAERRPVARRASRFGRQLSATLDDDERAIGRQAEHPEIVRRAAHAAQHGLGRAQRRRAMEHGGEQGLEILALPGLELAAREALLLPLCRAGARRLEAGGRRAAQREIARLGLARSHREHAHEIRRGAGCERERAAHAQGGVEHVAERARERGPRLERRGARERAATSHEARAVGLEADAARPEQRMGHHLRGGLRAARPPAREQHAPLGVRTRLEEELREGRMARVGAGVVQHQAEVGRHADAARSRARVVQPDPAQLGVRIARDHDLAGRLDAVLAAQDREAARRGRGLVALGRAGQRARERSTRRGRRPRRAGRAAAPRAPRPRRESSS